MATNSPLTRAGSPLNSPSRAGSESSAGRLRTRKLSSRTRCGPVGGECLVPRARPYGLVCHAQHLNRRYARSESTRVAFARERQIVVEVRLAPLKARRRSWGINRGVMSPEDASEILSNDSQN